MDDLKARITNALRKGHAPSSDFDLNPEVALPKGRTLRPAAVLIAIRQGPDARPEVLLTKRSAALKHHPGQIAFPGGKMDPGDSDLAETAAREAREEIGLPSEAIEIVGSLPSHETVTRFEVTPFVGLVRHPFTPVPEAGEVDEVFAVPLDHVLDTGRYAVQSRRWMGQDRHYFTVPFGPYYIWGATARMLRVWADLMT